MLVYSCILSEKVSCHDKTSISLQAMECRILRVVWKLQAFGIQEQGQAAQNNTAAMKPPVAQQHRTMEAAPSSSSGDQLHGLEGRAFPLQPWRGWQVGVNVSVVKASLKPSGTP